MAYISKVFGFPFKCFRCNTGGVLAQVHTNAKLSSITSDLISELKNSPCVKNYKKFQKNNHLYEPKNYKKFQKNNHLYEPKNYKKKKFQNMLFQSSKFSKLNLKMIVRNAASLREGAVLSLFHKILSVYYSNKNDQAFQNDLESFSKSVEFNQFCKILLVSLPKLPPNALVDFLYLTYFNVQVKNPVMQKILHLIYENIHCFLLCEILEIYVTLKTPYFQANAKCKDIFSACESYFENSFEDELSHHQNAYDLVYYLYEEALPISVRKLIAEKYFDFMERKCYRTPLYVKLFSALFEEPLISLYKPQILEHLKTTCNLLGSGLTLKALSAVYETGVHKYDSSYDEEVCNVMANKSCHPKVPVNASLCVANNLCLLGHLNYDLVNLIADNISECLPSAPLKVVSVFARTSFHEKNHNNWDKIKEKLIQVNAEETFPEVNDRIKWCEYLSFLGCDTRALLSRVFNTLNGHESNLMTSVDQNASYIQILQLHHFAEAHFSKDYEKLTKRTLNSCIEKAKFKTRFLHDFCLKEVLGSEDFFLNNCTTSRQHLLPAVMLLGPNNKFINLSSYKAQDVNFFKTTGNLRKFQMYVNIQNIEKPPGSKMIVFQLFFDRQPVEFRNSPKLSGLYRIFLKSIENVPSNIIVLQEKFFYKSLNEKCEFLKSKINEIMKSPEAESNNRIIF